MTGDEDIQKFKFYYTLVENVKLPFFGVRHVQIFLLFFMVFIALGFNVILSVTIVAMTDSTISKNPDIPIYHFQNKGAILSAFFCGYIWPQIIAGYVANRFGPKWFLLVAMSLQSTLGFFMPFTVKTFCSIGMCFNRAMQGFCQGFLFPSLTDQLGRWVPSQERSRLGAFAFGGVPLGIVVGMLSSGVVSATQYGWPLIYYIYGGLGGIWCVLFLILGSNDPERHSSISREEKFYITQNLRANRDQTLPAVPWKKILKSTPVWALLITQSGYIYCTSTFFSQIPSYLDHVMQFNIRNNGFISALPFFFLWILSFVFSFISDYLINKRILNIGKARKLFNSIGLLGSAISMLFLSYTDEHRPVKALILLVFATGFLASCMSGWSVNHIDLSPNFAGPLMGLTNGFAHISAIVSPLIAQFFVKNHNNPLEWRMVFLTTASVAIFSSIVFIIFGSGKIQTWNDEEKESNETESNNKIWT